MKTEISINGSLDPKANYVSWSPAPSQIRLTDIPGPAVPVDVRLSNQNSGQGGQLVFFGALSGTGQDQLQLTLPGDGSPVNFFIAGNFGNPSTTDQDAAVLVTNAGTGEELSVTRLMVRIRKNANELTPSERDRFLSALGVLNDRGMGPFSNFRSMHLDATSDEAHRFAGFPPWHRAYLLDLERELQRIDPSVALPYWKFDAAAPNLFNISFLGVPNDAGTVQYTFGHPLESWKTDDEVGFRRKPRFNTNTQLAGNSLGPVIDEETTLALGGVSNLFERFLRMEGQPHGRAHTSFDGPVNQIDTAARDPLFFLLHANVDRLWAKWQWVKNRFDVTSVSSYSFLGSAGDPGATRIGHNLNDTMWPWNQDTNSPRPGTAPGGEFPASLVASAPGLVPKVRAMIDYQGVVDPSNRLGFDYDDVPFEL